MPQTDFLDGATAVSDDDFLKDATPVKDADTRSLYERARDNFNANTQGAKPGDSPIKAAIENFGAGGGDVVRSIGHAVLHPIETAAQAIQAQEQEDEKPVSEQLKDLVTSGKILGPGGESLVSIAKGLVENPARTAGQIGAGLIAGEGAGKVLSAGTEGASSLARGIQRGKAAATQALYPENVSIPEHAEATQGLIKSLVPDAKAIPNIKSATSELPDALAAAQKKGVKIAGKLDAAQAIRDRASEIQEHFDTNILKPNKDIETSVPPNYNGNTTRGPNRATLGQINDRVNAINAELKSNFRKKLASETSEANASDADLLAEKRSLTKLLHEKLGEATGLSPEDIASVRQRAGKLRSLAQEVEVSADKDTVSEGRRDVSGGSLRGAIADRVGGGQEVTGNRVFQNALEKFAPAEKELPQPKPQQPTQATPRITDQWANKGAQILQKADSSFTDEEINNLRSTPKGRQLLMQGSSLSASSPLAKDLARRAREILGAAQ